MADIDAGHGGMTLAEQIAAAAGAAPGSDDDGLDGLDGLDGTPASSEATADPHGSPPSSEEGLEWTDGGQEEDAPPVTPQTTVDDPAPAVSRLIRNVRVKERELAAERGARRTEQAELQRLRAEVGRLSAGPQDADDPVDLLRGWAIRRLGLTEAQAGDPRVLQALQQATVDLTAEAFEASDADPALRERRIARQRQREEAGRFRSYEQRIAAMEEERAAAQEQAVVAEVRADATAYLSANAARTPNLSAAAEAGDVDPIALMMESAAEMIRSGQAPEPRSKADVGRLYALVLSNAERHYAALADRLSARRAGNVAPAIPVRNGGPRGDAGQQRQGDPRSRARGDAAGDGRRAQGAPTKATRGGGGRGSAGPDAREDDDGSGERPDLWTRVRRAELAARRGR
jgi:hypothetical protein